MEFLRQSGVLLHPTSLPGPFGIGDLGSQAYEFVDFLKAAGQTYWQILPLSPTGYGDSPYQALSAFAGNPMLISPEKLVEVGHLLPSDIEKAPIFQEDCVDFGAVIKHKTGLLNRAFSRFTQNAPSQERDRFITFCEQQAFWLDDFVLYMALKEQHDLQPWFEWDRELAERDPAALRLFRTSHLEAIEYQKYLQWQFLEQWMALRKYTNQQGIMIVGDIPIFVSRDSTDVWANLGLFEFDDQLQPTVVSGVPPDMFSDTGQFWGHPLYRWDRMVEEGFEWWIQRFQVVLAQVDVIRIDHFRGFYDYWAVPATEETAVNGQWLRAPGVELLRAVNEALGEVPIIAEDLGAYTKEQRAGVDAMLREFGYPGMKTLQFAFSTDASDPFLPHNYTNEWVVYTGTHDNDTTVGWFQVSSSESDREHALSYMNVDGTDIAWDMIRLAWASVADTAIVPAQDLLSLDHTARMNYPSSVGPPNWCWRLKPGELTTDLADRLLTLTRLYGRTPEPEIQGAHPDI